MTTKSRLLAGVALACAHPILATPLAAQDFSLGTIDLGESLRGVQTDTANSETVITQEEIEARQASTMVELLDTVPNAQLINGALPQGAALSIRGLGAQAGVFGADGRVAVVVDGVASGQEEIYRNGSLFALEPELFREVTVLRGPSESFNYTSGAMGGTVIAETKDAADFLEGEDTFALRQKLSFESNGNGAASSTILAFAPDDKLDVIAFAGYRRSDERKDGDGVTQDATGFKMPSGLLKANYQLNQDSALSFSVVYNEIPEEDVPYNAFNPSWSNVLVDRYTRDTTAYAAYTYDPIDNDLINLEARLTFKHEDLSISDPSNGSTSGIYSADHDTKTLGLRLENEAVFSTGGIDHTVLAGVELKRRERSAVLPTGTYAGQSDYSAPGGTDESLAVYVTDEILIGDALTLTPQLRYETQTLTSENNGTQMAFSHSCNCLVTYAAIPDGTEFKASGVAGALGARYELTEDFAVFGTAAYNKNLPILDDIRSSTNANKSEKGRTFELGVSYDSTDVFASGDALKAKVTAFKTDIDDVTTFSSASSIQIEGAEIELSYVNPAFFADFNMGRVRGTINNTSTPYNLAPADSAQLTLGKRFMDDQLTVTVGARHAWAQNRIAAGFGAPAASEAYTIYNASVSYIPTSGAAEGVEFRAAVENLTDETYRAFGNTRNGTGRTFKFSIAKTF